MTIQKFKMYIEYLKRKLKRRKEAFRDIEDKINSGIASSLDKQKYAELKGRIEELEDDLDAAEGMLNVPDNTAPFGKDEQS